MRLVGFIRGWSLGLRSSTVHVYPEANRVADASQELLCTSATSFSSFSLLPGNVKLALLYDFRGFAAPRSFPSQ